MEKIPAFRRGSRCASVFRGSRGLRCVMLLQKCPAVSRVQMLRLKKTARGDRMLRLDFCKMAVRERVRACNTDAEFDKVFSAEGEMD